MKAILQKFGLSLAVLMLIGFTNSTASFANGGCGGFTVYLVDSNGDPLEGGVLEYKDGGWHTATDLGGGEFCITTAKTDIDLKMTYLESDLTVNAPTNAPYTFQTVLVTFELRKRTGELGYNHATIQFVGYGPNPLATTGSAGLGLAQIELLPRAYNFRMKFRGGRGDITQDISENPVVTWEMARMLVQINKSDGTRGLNGAEIKYKGHSLETFGVTGTSENGRARRDLLPGTYKFTIKYKGGSMVIEDFVVSLGDNEIIFDGQAVTVELLDGATPVDGGVVTNLGITGNAFGTTGDSGSGIVTQDLLPLTYTFKMSYNGDNDEQVGIDCSAGAWVTFDVADLKSSVVKGSDLSLSAYPNPFAGNTTIAFDLEKDQFVTAEIYDLTGKRVAELYEGNMTVGNHKMKWDGQGVNSGLYIFKLTTETSSYSKSVVKN